MAVVPAGVLVPWPLEVLARVEGGEEEGGPHPLRVVGDELAGGDEGAERGGGHGCVAVGVDVGGGGVAVGGGAAGAECARGGEDGEGHCGLVDSGDCCAVELCLIDVEVCLVFYCQWRTWLCSVKQLDEVSFTIQSTYFGSHYSHPVQLQLALAYLCSALYSYNKRSAEGRRTELPSGETNG
jgi:hypothetical protein